MPQGSGLILFIIFIALAFDFLNGFHDAANSIATVVSIVLGIIVGIVSALRQYTGFWRIDRTEDENMIEFCDHLDVRWRRSLNQSNSTSSGNSGYAPL